MAKMRTIVVSALPGVVGRQYRSDQFFDAIETGVRAAAAGYEGKIFVAFDDGAMREFNRATKTFGALLPANPFEA